MMQRGDRFASFIASTTFSAALLCMSAANAATCNDPGIEAAIPVITLKEIVSDVEEPVALTHAPGEPDRVYVLEQDGRIRIVADDKLLVEPFLDITARVKNGGERGLLGLAFHPDYARSGYFYVNYTAERPDRSGDQLVTRISRFARGADGKADAASERVLLEIEQPFSNHNGGQIAFGPDGMLYIGMGDGGSADDPLGNGQNLATLLGKMLRIDAGIKAGSDARAYDIPADNPFIATRGARPEIWAYGLRNPWRFSFDRDTGLLYVGDVGQNRQEEIDVIARGGNYGWNLMEGDLCHRATPAQCARMELLRPILTYGRSDGVAVIGGYVYRGAAMPTLCGTYIYGDYGSGRVWGLRYADDHVGTQRELLHTDHSISAFGEDAIGELYLLDYGAGKILRIVAP
ncbi:MAG: PQQ-dependent sugar dehydrogenase [Chromatiales bacterium]|jgi:glucose/arabinose dehydrogenase|nr:PQQ-dependent sugar dehydrogenase [Chromatiales bacterium]